MREVCTHVDINAGPSRVWAILIDFAAYPRWNPLIRNVRGSPSQGDRVQVTEQLSAGSLGVSPSPVTTVERTLKYASESHQLSWLGDWLSAWIYATERRFRIEALPEGGVRFHQSESFSGVLAGFAWSRLRRDLPPAFDGMNNALKARAERAESHPAKAEARGD
jgi:hypothetical protein